MTGSVMVRFLLTSGRGELNLAFADRGEVEWVWGERSQSNT
jgi:hypothetical protein